MSQENANPTYENVEFQLSNIKISGKRWHKGANVKVIALHGWLDNCGSFDWLLPLLPAVDCVAIDLAGQGLSDFRAGSGAYNIWQDLSEIVELSKQLGWEKFSLLGHSRGAMISTLFAGTFPEKIDRLCLLDALLPRPAIDTKLPQNLASSIIKTTAANLKANSVYPSFEEAVFARMKGKVPVGEAASKQLAIRGVTSNERGFYWRYDRRLLMPSEIRLNETQLFAFLDALPCKALIIKGSESKMDVHELVKQFTTHQNIEIKIQPGQHHFHLEDDDQLRQQLANRIFEYLSA